ncbi:deiodinase-related protein, partial [Enterococcus faecium]
MTASAGPALQQLYDEFGDRVRFLTLYVREAHPGDRYVQPGDMATKIAHARAYAERDGIRWPVGVDDVDRTL